VPEGRVEEAIERFRGFLEGDDRYPGLIPEDFEYGVEPPPGVSLDYDPGSGRLRVRFADPDAEVTFRWVDYGWQIEEYPRDLAASEADLVRALVSLEERIRALEELCRQLGGRR